MAVDVSKVSELDVGPGELPETMAAWVIREERFGATPSRSRRSRCPSPARSR
jgi:hypothetical protein